MRFLVENLCLTCKDACRWGRDRKESRPIVYSGGGRLLEQARQALGTSTIKETVNTALLEETVRAAWCRSITKEDLRRAGELLQDLGDPEIMAKAWE